MSDSLGMIETKGLVAMIEAAERVIAVPRVDADGRLAAYALANNSEERQPVRRNHASNERCPRACSVASTGGMPRARARR